MVCLKSAMLERRPDLPLCNLRRLRQLGLVGSSSRNTTSGNSTSRLIRELFCPKHLHQTEVDICHLLQSPVKVGPDLKVDPGVGVERDVMIPCRLTTVTIKCQEEGDELKYDDRSPFFIRREMKASGHSMPQKNQIAIGKKIVGRLGKDDHWVTTSTAGWTFTAATAELPEESNRPIDVFRVHKRQALAPSESAVPREFYQIRSRYRTAATEVQRHLATADAAKRYRLLFRNEGFPKGSNEGVLLDEPTHGTCTPVGDKGERGGMVDDTTAPNDTWGSDPRRPFVHAGQACQPFSKREVPELGGRFIRKHNPNNVRAQNKPKSGRRRRRKEVQPTEMLRQRGDWSKLKAPPSSTRSPETCAVDSTRPRTEASHRRRRLTPQTQYSARDDSGMDRRRGHCSNEERRGSFICSNCVRGERMTPRPPPSQNRFGPRYRGGEAKGRKAPHTNRVTLHRGLVITEDFKRELLNPLSRRFGLARGRG